MGYNYVCIPVDFLTSASVNIDSLLTWETKITISNNMIIAKAITDFLLNKVITILHISPQSTAPECNTIEDQILCPVYFIEQVNSMLLCELISFCKRFLVVPMVKFVVTKYENYFVTIFPYLIKVSCKTIGLNKCAVVTSTYSYVWCASLTNSWTHFCMSIWLYMYNHFSIQLIFLIIFKKYSFQFGSWLSL